MNAIEGKYPASGSPGGTGLRRLGNRVRAWKERGKLTIGSLVILPHDLGTWREACAVRAEQLVVVPSQVDPSRRQC